MTRSAYPSDLTAAQWALVAPLLPAPKSGKQGGRPRTVNLREVLNGIFYFLKGCGGWRYLPHDLPPWGTVHYYYRQWRRDGTWQRLHEALREEVRRAAEREVSPSAAVMDSQSVATSKKGPRSYDQGKHVKGRKRHLIVDTPGLILALAVLPAGGSDRAGGEKLLSRLLKRFPRPAKLWADSAYQGLVDWAAALGGWVMEIVHKAAGQVGFEVQPHRWIVERTFAWLENYHRLGKDYECLPESSEALIYLAMIHLMLRRLAPAS